MKFILMIVFHLISLVSFALFLGVVFLWTNAADGPQTISAVDFRVRFITSDTGIGIFGDGGGYNPFQEWEYQVGAPGHWPYRLRVFKEPMDDEIVGALGFSYLPQSGNHKLFARYISLAVLFGALPLCWMLLTTRRFLRKKPMQTSDVNEETAKTGSST